MAPSLTTKRIAKLARPGRYRDRDSRGLYLQVGRTGGKSWLLRYEIDGRERFMGLGSLDDFTLKEARERAWAARQKLADGIDPIEHRLAERDARRAEAINSITFRQATSEFLRQHEDGWKNHKHTRQWLATLERYAFPKLGDRPVRAIDAAVVNDALAPIWARIPATASRVRGRVERVVRWVEEGKPLPTPSASKTANHHRALPYAEVPAFISALADMPGTAPRALEFLVLTAARAGEVNGATWDEVDLDAKLWTIPSSRMKAGREHAVPLSDRAVDILNALPTEDGNPHVFLGAKRGAGLSPMAMTQVLRRMGWGDNTSVHGLRSSFRDWCGDQTAFPRDVAESALAHQVRDRVEAAYRRGSALEKRRKLMAAWAAFCTSPPAVKTADVVPIRGKK